MKSILALLLVFTCSISIAQTDSVSLTGTWELSNYVYGDHDATTPIQSNFKRYKVFTPTHFTVINVDSESNITTTSIFGTYTLSGNNYTEKILHVNKESSKMIGSEFSFQLKFQGGDMLSQVGGFNGMKTDETWMRVK